VTAAGRWAAQFISRTLLKTLSFATLHFGVAFYFHERAWRRVDGGERAANNGPVMCCGVLGAK